MARRSRADPLSVLLVLAAVYLFYLAVPNVGPVVRAANGGGLPGVFTASTLSCVKHPGHETCGWAGEFRSDDGGLVRTETYLHGSGRETLRAGERTRAFDVGRSSRVYGPEGSREWVTVAVMLLLGAALGVVVCVRVRRRFRPVPAEAGP